MTEPAGQPPKKASAKKASAKQASARRVTAKKAAVKKAAANAADKQPADEQPAAARRPTTPTMADGDDVVHAAAQIISIFEAQPDLFLAACANPVRAMLDAGVELSPRAQRYVTLRCRFTQAEAERLERLAQQIDEHLGDVDPDDDATIAAALRKLGVNVELPEPVGSPYPADVASDPRPQQSAAKPKVGSTPAVPRKRGSVTHPNRRTVLTAAENLAQVRRWREAKRTGPDPFEAYSGEHPVIGPLLEYRKQSATQPRFASAEVYDRLTRTTSGQLSDGINITLRVRLSGSGPGSDD